MSGRTAWGLAWRNLRRHRARTALTGAAIFGGVFVVLLLAGLSQGFQRMARDELVLSRTGALQVHRAGYLALRDSPPLALDMPEAGALVARIAAAPGVRAVAPRLNFVAMLHLGDAVALCQVRGLEPRRDGQVLPWGHAEGTDAGHIVLGDQLAARLAAAPGAGAVLQATSLTGQVEAADATVARIFAGAELESQQVVEMPLAEAQLLVHLPGRVSEFIVAIDDLDALTTAKATLQAAVGADYEVASWEDLNPNIVEVVRILDLAVDAVGIISLIIVCFGIVNSVRMSVQERTREIGTMIAVGMRRRAVGAMFLREATLLAVGATALAFALALALQLGAAQAGGLRVLSIGNQAVLYPLLPAIPPLTAGITLVLAIGGTVLAAAAPALRAARMRPVEALMAI